MSDSQLDVTQPTCRRQLCNCVGTVWTLWSTKRCLLVAVLGTMSAQGTIMAGEGSEDESDDSLSVGTPLSLG